MAQRLQPGPISRVGYRGSRYEPCVEWLLKLTRMLPQHKSAVATAKQRLSLESMLGTRVIVLREPAPSSTVAGYIVPRDSDQAPNSASNRRSVAVLPGRQPLALRDDGVLRVPGAGHAGVEHAEPGEQRAGRQQRP